MKLKIYHTTLQTALGELNLAASDNGLCLLEFDNKNRISHHFEQIKKYLDFELIENKSNTILDLDLRKKTGCNVIGFKTQENEYIINPDSNTKLENAI